MAAHMHRASALLAWNIAMRVCYDALTPRERYMAKYRARRFTIPRSPIEVAGIATACSRHCNAIICTVYARLGAVNSA